MAFKRDMRHHDYVLYIENGCRGINMASWKQWPKALTKPSRAHEPPSTTPKNHDTSPL
jgi:hypothetical protein